MGEQTPLSNKEKIYIFLPLFLALALAGGTWLGFKLANFNRNAYVVLSEDGGYAGQSGKVEEILRFIDARYLENQDKTALEDAAIHAIVHELDPHSTYISLDNIAKVNESLNGNFDGIGIEFFILDDTIYVVGVIDGGPSDKAGLQKGDKIIMINDTLVSGKGIYHKSVVDNLKGEAGSNVKLKVKRTGEKALKEINITRGHIPMYSVDVAYMLNKNTGFIKINRFSSTTYAEFMTALEELVNNHKMQNLVLDLRHNPGGYLDAATKMLGELFTARKLLVYTEGRSHHRLERNSTGQCKFNIGKVAILIDENSASASEIMAGAIQDHDRGLVIGRRSFGKGLVQEQYKLSDGSALRLTVARYFTPSGRYIQKPYDGSEGIYGEDLEQRYNSGELYHRDSIHVKDSTVYKTSGGRTVFGGGGIIPDIFIPLDTTLFDPYFLSINGYVRDYVYRYMDDKRQSFKKQYPSFESFDGSFRVTDEMFEQLMRYAISKGVERNETLLAKFKDELKQQIKTYIADQLFAAQGLYRSVYKKDEMILRAVSEIEKESSTNPSAMNGK